MTPIIESARVSYLINTLSLALLPKESGYIGLLGRSAQNVKSASASTGGEVELAAQSHNYYMLTSNLPINYLHWLESDDTHILVEGGPVDYFIFHPPSPASHSEAKAEKITLGNDFAKGQVPVVSVPGGCWKALRLHDGADLALMFNVLSPEFTEDRVRIGEGKDWVEMFRGKASWATENELRLMVGGENWIEHEGAKFDGQS